MPRTARVAPGGVIFHCLNRGNDRRAIFDDAGDFAAFERALAATLDALPGVRLLAYCLMPNHWHLLLWPRRDGELAAFMQRLTTTHVRRWHRHRHSDGRGHLYQGTYKSFPVQDDAHFLTVARYVERNALRASLVGRAEDWRWGSLWRRERDAPQERGLLAEWPVARPADCARKTGQVRLWQVADIRHGSPWLEAHRRRKRERHVFSKNLQLTLRVG